MRHPGPLGHVSAKPWSSDPARAARWRALLLAGAAVLVLAPATAWAQEDAEAPQNPAEALGLQGLNNTPTEPPLSYPSAPPPRAAQPSDGLAPDDVYLESNLLIDDTPSHTITARGNVETRHQGRTLRADEITYDTMTGAAHAHGHVALISADGSVEQSDDLVLDDKMRAGVATAFAARLVGNVTIIAGAAIRRSADVNELKSAIYTPCNICNADGSPKEPTWSVQASTIVEDKLHEVVYYRNALIRIKGIPVLYSPWFWHADPEADRRSGLLPPKIRYANRLGVSYEQPYLWSISPYADLVISPVFTTELNPFLNLEFRERFYSGVLHARVGYTFEKNFDAAGRYGKARSRTYILADGVFQLDDKWRWGFGAERVSDPTLFARYRIDNIYRPGGRGPFTTDTQRLLSQIYTERQDTNSYISISALSFQSLRVLQQGRTLISYDPTNAFPLVAPLIEARINPPDPILGGRLRILGTAVALSRNQDTSLITPAGQLQNQTIDDRRASAEFDWRASHTFANGMRVEPFAQGRADVYSINNPLVASPQKGFARGVASVGADFSYPFIRQTASSTIILEPLAQIAISPDYHANPIVPNEDSVALEFDATNLFTINRFPGFDLYEGGRRANLGGRASVNWGAGHSATVLVGRSFRDQANPSFYAGSGLEGRSSDWVTEVTLKPLTGVSAFSRSRIANDLRVRREEAGLDVTVWRVTASARYLYSEQDSSGVRTELLNLGATAKLSKHFGVSVAAVHDLNAKLWPFSQASIYYQDECLRVDLIYTRDQTFASTIVPSNALQVRLTLATLGGQGR